MNKKAEAEIVDQKSALDLKRAAESEINEILMNLYRKTGLKPTRFEFAIGFQDWMITDSVIHLR